MTRLKICGMKYPENILKISSLRPDYMGFIFYPKSKRYLEEAIPEIDSSIKKVGVFVNQPLNFILEKIEEYKLAAIQLHGEESPDFCNFLRSSAPKIEIIKAFAVDSNFDFSQIDHFEMVCDYFLFDTKGKEKGGNGMAFDWEIMDNYPSSKPYFLSGGIGLESVDALRNFLVTDSAKYCIALDVNSKFEQESGLKIFELLKEFKTNGF